MEITKQTLVGDLIRFDRGTAEVLMSAGMHCVGCPAAQGESIEQACIVHGLDPDAVFTQIEAYLNAKK